MSSERYKCNRCDTIMYLNSFDEKVCSACDSSNISLYSGNLHKKWEDDKKKENNEKDNKDKADKNWWHYL